MTCNPNERRDTPLALKLKERIRRHGPITVFEYMRACLHDPEYGYYVKQPAIGAQGDFITAPEISQVFGELIGLWCAVVWQQMGSPLPVHLVELGPGRGTLMRDALRAARLVPGFLDATRVHLVESSETLRDAQRRFLEDSAPAIAWHARVEDLPRGPAIVIANEFLDALPIEQITSSSGEWRRRCVGLEAEGSFAFVAGDTAKAAPPPVLARAAKEGDVFERLDGACEVLGALADRCGGAHSALVIDYGHERRSLGDTLQGVLKHGYVSPFAAPGETDLTVQVDFEHAATTCAEAGLVVDGPITQAEFLGRLGIIERASRLMSANPARAGEIEAGVARLIAPNGMGTRFKVLGVRSAGLPVLPGFVA